MSPNEAAALDVIGYIFVPSFALFKRLRCRLGRPSPPPPFLRGRTLGTEHWAFHPMRGTPRRCACVEKPNLSKMPRNECSALLLKDPRCCTWCLVLRMRQIRIRIPGILLVLRCGNVKRRATAKGRGHRTLGVVVLVACSVCLVLCPRMREK